MKNQLAKFYVYLWIAACALGISACGGSGREANPNIKSSVASTSSVASSESAQSQASSNLSSSSSSSVSNLSSASSSASDLSSASSSSTSSLSSTSSTSLASQSSAASSMAPVDPKLRFNTGGTRIDITSSFAPVARLEWEGAQTPYTLTITSGSLPPGISLQIDGELVGTSSAAGEYVFTARAEQDNGEIIFQTFTIGVNESALAGSTHSLEFTSEHTGLPVVFSIYLPPGYENSDQDYPVIYHLHGINGRHNREQIHAVPTSLESAVRDGLIGEAIIVFPDGYTDSFWADSFSEEAPAETHIVADLIPYIDAHYRTRADRQYRVIQGFSMGGFGAAKFAAKFPELFATCVTYDAALLTWADILRRHGPDQGSDKNVASNHFNNHEVFFNQYSPWYWLEENAEALRSAVAFRVVGGTLLAEANERWRNQLEEQDQQFDFVATDLEHALAPLLSAQGANSWKFIAARLGSL